MSSVWTVIDRVKPPLKLTSHEELHRANPAVAEQKMQDAWFSQHIQAEPNAPSRCVTEPDATNFATIVD